MRTKLGDQQYPSRATRTEIADNAESASSEAAIGACDDAIGVEFARFILLGLRPRLHCTLVFDLNAFDFARRLESPFTVCH